MKSSALIVALATAAIGAHSPSFATISPNAAQIRADAARASSASYAHRALVPGRVFDRFYNVWLENTNFDKAVGQSGLKELAKEGILLTNYFGLTHPSMPNYVASVGGDYFGIADDSFVRVPSNVSTIVDLLESRGISWAEYQEHMPYSGFEGFNFSNQDTFAPDYVRKHNPLVIFDSVANNASRLANLKNFTEFHRDLEARALPQWSFITPNMTNDGHDTNIMVAGNWARNFLMPLVRDSEFANRTLIVLTFDENETYRLPNHIYAMLLGDIPRELRGTTDDTFYTHYSLISSVEANWDLANLGRYDVGANVFEIIANKTGHRNVHVDSSHLTLNQSYDGWFTNLSHPIPAPNLAHNARAAGAGTVLPLVEQIWRNASAASNSTDAGYGGDHSFTALPGKPKEPQASGTSPTTTPPGTASSAAASLLSAERARLALVC